MTVSAPAAAEKRGLRVGQVRLTDSAPLVIAQEAGLFEKYGLDVTLSQEVSWANVRDKLAAGALDAAQMLAPLPAMTSFGVSGLRVPMLYGLTLSLNGNAITLSAPLWNAVRMRCTETGPRQTAEALRSVIAGRSGRLTLGVVHSFSTHRILLRAWLRAGGIDPDTDVRTLVVPPAQMVDSLASGAIDGYCVGEPWNSLAVHSGLGAIAAVGSEVWRNAPEKVLAVTQRWHEHHPATHLRLRLALMEAGNWLSEPAHRREAATILAHPDHLDLPESRLLPSLTGRLLLEPGGEAREVEDFHVFSVGLAGFPWRSQAEFLIDRCSELLGDPIEPDRRVALAQQTARPDLFREAARHLGISTPRTDRMPQGTADDGTGLLAIESGMQVRATSVLAGSGSESAPG